MGVPYRITVRVSEETMIKLEELVDKFKYENVSDIVRKAIDEFVERNLGKGPVKKIDLELPRKLIEQLGNDIAEGNAVSMDDLIREILREHMSAKLNKEFKEISKEHSHS
ncbi:MAG: ribbon-helix-helix protein, CopG family [Thermoplasmataceae archaeon]